jgi:hypothetical protein
MAAHDSPSLAPLSLPSGLPFAGATLPVTIYDLFDFSLTGINARALDVKKVDAAFSWRDAAKRRIFSGGGTIWEADQCPFAFIT